MAFRHIFWLIAIAWVMLWLGSLWTIGGLMGVSATIILVYVVMAFAPPVFLYGVLFIAIPWIAKKLKRPATHL